MCNNVTGLNNSNQPHGESPEKDQLSELLRVVNLTRLNRIHASNRLLGTEQFVQYINIYYSCVTAVITILSLRYPDSSFGIASAIMTVALAISIVYLNAQKYGNRAQQLQMNYLALHQLRFDIENAKRNSDFSELKELENRYVHLLQTSENHIEHDYRKTLWLNDRKHKCKENYRPKLFGLEWIKFFIREICWLALRIILWALPIVYFILVLLQIL